MKIEHVAFVVQDPAAAAKWYVDNLGFTIKRAMHESPFTHFLADDSGKVMIEIYRQPHLRVPDYRDTDPLLLHLALVSKDVEADRKRWMAAGATRRSEKRPISITVTCWRCCGTRGGLRFNWCSAPSRWCEGRIKSLYQPAAQAR